MSPLVIVFGGGALVALVVIMAVRATNRGPRTGDSGGGWDPGYSTYGDSGANYAATGTGDAETANGADDCSDTGSDSGGSDGGGDCSSDGGGGDGGGGD